MIKVRSKGFGLILVLMALGAVRLCLAESGDDPPNERYIEDLGWTSLPAPQEPLAAVPASDAPTGVTDATDRSESDSDQNTVSPVTNPTLQLALAASAGIVVGLFCRNFFSRIWGRRVGMARHPSS